MTLDEQTVGNDGLIQPPVPTIPLESSEKMEGSVSVLRDFGFNLFARLAGMLFGIANQSMLAWFLGPVERGAYAIALIFGNILALVFTFGIDQAGQYYVASGKLSPVRGTWMTLLLSTALSVLALAIGVGLLAFDVEFFAKAPTHSFIIALVLVPFSILNTSTTFLIMGLREFKALAFTSIAASASQVVSLLLFLATIGLGVGEALWCAVISGFVQLAMNLRVLRAKGALGSSPFRLDDAKALLSYGARIYVGSITVPLNVQVGTVLIAFFALGEEIGLFAVAVDFITRVVLLPDLVAQVVQTRVASDSLGRPELVARTTRVVTLISIAIVGIILVTSWFVVPILFSPEFEPMIPLLWILGGGVAFRCATKALTPYLNGTNRPEVFSLAALVGILVNLGLIALLFPSGRLSGASWALTGSYVSSGVIIMIAFMRYSGLSIRETWTPRRTDFTDLMAGEEELWGRLVTRVGQ